MVEYTVETLVHLYDSLNNQIESAQNDLHMCNLNVSVIPDETRAEFEEAYIKTEKRLEKLISMRDNIEELLNKILKAEVNE